MTIAQDLLHKLPPGEVIPLSAMRPIAGWNSTNQSYAVKSGAVTPLPVPPAGRRGYLITRDEAVVIAVAAALALLAGVAVVSMIRAIKGAGLDAAALAASMQGRP